MKIVRNAPLMLIAAGVLALGPMLAPLAPSATALPQSIQVAIVGGEASINGGGLYTSDPAFSGFAITFIQPGAITPTALAAYDTVVLNAASSAMGCSIGTLSAAEKQALVGFVAAGGKLVMYDSECQPSNDYSWLPYPFTTNNPGAFGASGTLSIIEENTLSCSTVGSPCYVDVNLVGSNTDAVGDSNVVTTQDYHWCGDLRSTNANGFVGYSHMYADYGSGLLIYNGLDVDYLPGTLDQTGAGYLGRIWLNELLQPWGPSNLPCTVRVACETGQALPFTLDLVRPALGFDYFNDAAQAQVPALPLPRVLGALTLEATSSDVANTASVDFFVDGAPIGGGVSPPYTAVWPGGAPGLHTLTVRASDAQFGCTGSLQRLVLVPEPAMVGDAVGVFASSPTPGFVEVEAMGAHLLDGSQSTHGERRVVDHWVGDTHVEAVEDVVDAVAAESSYAVATSSTLARVSVAGGLIQAEGLRSDASARLDRLTFATTSSGRAGFSNLVVAGTPFPASVPPNTRVDVPGLGHVVLNEVLRTSAGGREVVVANALHVYVANAQAREEIVLAQAVAGVDLLGARIVPGARELTPQDDAGLGRDASDAFASADPIPAPLMQGRFEGSDVHDVYSVPAVEGEKIVVTLVPSSGAALQVDEVRFPPASLGATGVERTELPDLALRLLEPGSALPREDSDLPLSAPERVELNVDVDGVWVIEVSSPYGMPGNYTLHVSVTPIVFLPEDEVTGVDAPSTCADAILPRAELVDGVLRGDDYVDMWALDARIGDDVSAVLKPGDDADGADFDLLIYDVDCQLLVASGLGKGVVPKGAPDAAVHLPVETTGRYVVEVRRMNGVGNYHLDLRATTPIPDAPANDATSGADASADCAAATPLALGQGLYEGRIEDGDAGDVYSFAVPAQARVHVTVVPSAGSSLGVTLADGACVALVGQVAGLVPAAISYGPAASAGTYTVSIQPQIGGGNYLLNVLVVPSPTA